MFTTKLKTLHSSLTRFKTLNSTASHRISQMITGLKTQQLNHSYQLQPTLANDLNNQRSDEERSFQQNENSSKSDIEALKQWLQFSGKDDKPPKGFEKFFKKREEETAQKSEESEKPKASGQPEKEKEVKEEKKTKEEEQISEDEDPKKGGDKQSGEQSQQQQGWRKYMFDENNNPKPEGLVTLLMLGFTGYYLVTYRKPMQELVYLDFLNNYLLKNLVKEINISKDRRSEVFNHRAEIVTTQGERFYMTLGSYENFLAKLDMVQREMGKQPSEFIPVKYINQSEDQFSNIMLNVMIGGMFLLFFYQVLKNRNQPGNTGKNATKGGKQPTNQNKEGGWFNQQGGGFQDMFGYGKSNATVYGEEKKIKVKFKDVAGNENAKVEVMEFVDFLKDPKKYQKLGARVPRGALLVGPPGCGKTLLAKAVAGEAKVPFFSISGSDFVEMFVGVGASRVRDLFKKARQKAPAIIFIDEIDAVGKKRHGKYGGGNDERDNTLNQLLVEMDGFQTDTSVIVLAATNRKDMLDSALLRPGRFDRTIEITLPSIKEREQIFNVHLKKIKHNEKLQKEEYAKKVSALTPGFSGADIKNICNEAAILAARKNLPSVGIKEFEEATERVIGGIEKKLPLSDFERRTVAYHEAGHAVAGWFLEFSNPLLKVTIIPRAKGALGFAQYLPDELNLYSKNQLVDMMVMALGGRVAEEVFFNRITTGASDDIKKVTSIAQAICTQYGMSAALGTLNYDIEEGYQKPYSQKTNRLIDQEVKAIIDECYRQCKAIISEKKDLVQKMGDALLKKETLALPDIVDLLGPRPYPLKESIREYLEELKIRAVEDEQKESEQQTVEDVSKSTTEQTEQQNQNPEQKQ